MNKINLILLLLTSHLMFANSDELISSTEVPTTSINNQNMTNNTSVSSTSAESQDETSTLPSSTTATSIASENQLKVSNLITSTPAAAVESASTAAAATTEVQTSEAITMDVTATEITSSSSHVDLITNIPTAAAAPTTLHNNGNEDEDSVVSFGIRSFTVEVSKGDEKIATTTTAGVTTQTDASSTVADVVAPSASEKSLETTLAAATTTTGTTGASHSFPLLKSDLNILFSDDSSNTDANDDEGETTVLLNSQENEIANEIQIDKKLDNGLYRIKIGEITTDEFSNGLNFNEPGEEDKLHRVPPKKVNIDDFFPSKIEDFRPIIEISNEKLLKEKDALHNEQVVLREEIILNEEPEVESKSGTRINTSNVASTNIEIELIDDATLAAVAEISTRAEEIVTEVPSQTINVEDVFIPRRSKKFDPKSNTQGPTRTHDFGMTKFNQKKLNVSLNSAVNGKPEYSTTKFYNSKELYNEILHKSSKGESTVAPSTTKSNIVREKLISTNKIPIDPSRIAATTTVDSLTTTNAPPSTNSQQQQQRTYTPRPRVISRLEEKLNQLDCDIQNLSADSTVWRGNETHELNLPITVSAFNFFFFLYFFTHLSVSST